MNDLIALLKVYSERYIHCSQEQAEIDVKNNREAMAETFCAILHYAISMAEGETKNV